MSGATAVAKPAPQRSHHGRGGPADGKAGPLKPSDVKYFPFCAEISKYEKLAKVGEGTFGYDLLMMHDCTKRSSIYMIQTESFEIHFFLIRVEVHVCTLFLSCVTRNILGKCLKLETGRPTELWH